MSANSGFGEMARFIGSRAQASLPPNGTCLRDAEASRPHVMLSAPAFSSLILLVERRRTRMVVYKRASRPLLFLFLKTRRHGVSALPGSPLFAS
ncbi:hypothetical protein SRHO_G00022640 [Serrasalmus rhombeus]